MRTSRFTQLDDDIPAMQERERHASRDALPLVQ
ncbi:hypothetical protein RBXJA2T_02482 [Rubrivivax benzoatilyticus JA2 = ATCC BAA-35]|nr:hypothetical protein RBXJA2T_02482 [Rubrivivax benzoatilyticus JA2 = ATCC BAA-35]